MKPIVLYSTRGGNTEKVAREIAHKLNCQCIKITKDFDSSTINLNDFDLIIIGTGNYAARPNHNMLKFLHQMNVEGNKQFALFLTWFGRSTTDKSVFKKMKAAVEVKGQNLHDNYFKCLGGPHNVVQRGFTRLIGCREAGGHPDSEDLNAAKKWASKITEFIQKSP